MRVHAANYLDAHAWAHSGARNGSDQRVQLRIGVTKYSATAQEARRLAAELIAAADEVESTDADAAGNG